MNELLKHISVDDIQKNPFQPRSYFNPEDIQELAQSIKENGLIQPIIVRPSEILGYELIAGERRLRASKLAGLRSIPAIVKQISDEDSRKQAIIENLQRSNLNPIEEAKAYKQVIEHNHLTHDELAIYMGKSRPYISNMLRLLSLPDDIIKAIEVNSISQGHARVLLSLKNEEEQIYWKNRIISDHLSVRNLEKVIKQTHSKKGEPKKTDIFTKTLEEKISQYIGIPATITQGKAYQGQIVLPFHSEEDFNRIIHFLTPPCD